RQPPPAQHCKGAYKMVKDFLTDTLAEIHEQPRKFSNPDVAFDAFCLGIGEILAQYHEKT
ncbi:hypothetical protein, partial [Halomonas sp. 3D7M]|uniref:hypothetical protein n=1 Tax=Halomonas sp. 3D7M TaxID=2742617 RepID=UPI001D032708